MGAALRPLIFLVAAASGCASANGTGGGEGGAKVEALPSQADLCKVHRGNIPPSAEHGDRTYGTNAEDVLGIWGAPATKDGAKWTYEWCLAADCKAHATVTVTFENADLCTRQGTKVTPGQYVSEVSAKGMNRPQCWDEYEHAIGSDPCPECVPTQTLVVCGS